MEIMMMVPGGTKWVTHLLFSIRQPQRQEGEVGQCKICTSFHLLLPSAFYSICCRFFFFNGRTLVLPNSQFIIIIIIIIIVPCCCNLTFSLPPSINQSINKFIVNCFFSLAESKPMYKILLSFFFSRSLIDKLILLIPSKLILIVHFLNLKLFQSEEQTKKWKMEKKTISTK